MNLLFPRSQDAVLHSRIIEARKNKTLVYDIVDIDMNATRMDYTPRMKLVNEKVPTVGHRLPELFYEHYRRYHPLFWRYCLDQWLPLSTNIVVMYTTSAMMPIEYEGVKDKRPYVCALLLYVKRPLQRVIYGRALCSRSFCGSKLIDYMIKTYTDHKEYDYITMHSDPSVTGLYKKNGWREGTTFKTDLFGVQYPFMYRGLCEAVKDTPAEDVPLPDWPASPYTLGICIFLIFMYMIYKSRRT